MTATVADCHNCEKPLAPIRIRRKARFCSPSCRNAFARGSYRAANPRSPLSTGKTGAISELIVAADLLRRGFDVFRALSQSCSCDLAILRNGKLLRVEVRTASRSISGGLVYQKRGIDADHVAVVCGDLLEYRPPLPEFN